MTDQELVAAVKAAAIAYITAVRAATNAGLTINVAAGFPTEFSPSVENLMTVRAHRKIEA